MKDLIIYQLEVACCLALFYLFYMLLLRKETNFSIKRLYFICTGIMAFVLPALHIQFSISTEEIPVEYINIIPSQLIAYTPSAIQPDMLDAWLLISILWGTGCAILLFRLVFSLSNIGKILKETTNCPEGQSFKITKAKIQSFSFFKIIVLNAQHYHSKAKKYILAHEQAHSRQYHSIDVILVELLKTIQWFNPIAWLFGKESLQNLEYLADKEVADTLQNTQDYQMAIVKFSHQSSSKLLRSEFSKSNLKNRIVMMNQQRNQKISSIKLLLLLPLLAILFMSFSVKFETLDLKKEVSAILPQLNTISNDNNESAVLDSAYPLVVNSTPIQNLQRKSAPIIKTQIEENSDTTDNQTKEVFIIVEKMPTPSTGDMDSYYQEIYKDLNYPKKAKRNKITGKVFVEFIVQKDGTLREVKAVKGINPDCDEEAVRVIKNGPKWFPAEQKGIKVDVKMILHIPFGVPLKTSQNIKTRIIKGEVVSEKGTSIPGASVAVVGTQTGTFSDPTGKFDINVKTSPRDQLELVVSARGFSTEIIPITKEDNYKIILPRRYKHVLPTSYEPLSDSLSTDDDENPLVILDGKEITYEQMKKMDTNPDIRIDQISVLKDASAVNKYGQKAKNGVIIVTTKE